MSDRPDARGYEAGPEYYLALWSEQVRNIRPMGPNNYSIDIEGTPELDDFIKWWRSNREAYPERWSANVAENFNLQNSYVTTTNTANTTTYILPTNTIKEQDMKTAVAERVSGYVGTVYALIDGGIVPIADTKPYSSKEKASKAVKKLAVKLAKRK